MQILIYLFAMARINLNVLFNIMNDVLIIVELMCNRLERFSRACTLRIKGTKLYRKYSTLIFSTFNVLYISPWNVDIKHNKWKWKVKHPFFWTCLWLINKRWQTEIHANSPKWDWFVYEAVGVEAKAAFQLDIKQACNLQLSYFCSQKHTASETPCLKLLRNGLWAERCDKNIISCIRISGHFYDAWYVAVSKILVCKIIVHLKNKP